MKRLLLAVAIFGMAQLSSKAQTTLYSENFESAALGGLPTGWTTTQNFNLGWRADSANSSTAYTGASAVNNIIIRNSDSSGTYTLYSKSIATTGYSGISVLWAARNSTNFTSSGSSTPVFEYSVDNGTTWTAKTFIENTANSTWALVNNGNSIALNADANNQSAVICRWTVNIVNNTSGTYRIDDFSLSGFNSSGINNLIASDNLAYVYQNNSITFQFENNADRVIEIRSIDGKMISTTRTTVKSQTINLQGVSKGMYIVKVVDNQHLNVITRKIMFN